MKRLQLVDLDDPPTTVLEELAATHELHELAVEDACEAHHQRPKLDLFDESLSFVIKTAVYDDEAERVAFGEMVILARPGLVITVRHGEACHLPATRSLVDEDDPGGSFVALHALVDHVTDLYEPVMNSIEQDLFEIEQDVFSPDRTNPAERIYRLKREVLEMRRNISPLVRPVSSLANDRRIDVPSELRDYFADVEDHVRRVVDRIRQADTLLSEVLDANLAQLSVQQNADMRRMTAWAVLFLVPTLLAGVWGMNFARMPELDWFLGYPLALVSMAGTTGYFWFRLKRAGWL